MRRLPSLTTICSKQMSGALVSAQERGLFRSRRKFLPRQTGANPEDEEFPGAGEKSSPSDRLNPPNRAESGEIRRIRRGTAVAL
jgi:hypothetical protein